MFDLRQIYLVNLKKGSRTQMSFVGEFASEIFLKSRFHCSALYHKAIFRPPKYFFKECSCETRLPATHFWSNYCV